jgi:hypothetical protein
MRLSIFNQKVLLQELFVHILITFSCRHFFCFLLLMSFVDGICFIVDVSTGYVEEQLGWISGLPSASYCCKLNILIFNLRQKDWIFSLSSASFSSSFINLNLLHQFNTQVWPKCISHFNYKKDCQIIGAYVESLGLPALISTSNFIVLYFLVYYFFDLHLQFKTTPP